MIKHNFRIILLGLFLTSIIFSCQTDPLDTDTTSDTSLFLGSGIDYITDDASLLPGETFTVELNGSKGDFEMNGISVYADGVKLSTDRYTIDGQTPAANPITLFDNDRIGFTKVIAVTAQNDASIVSYSFEVIDLDLNTVSVGLDITTEATGPTLELNSSNSITVSPESWIAFPVTATPGTFPLFSIAVYQGSELVSDVTRLAYDELAQSFTSNPSGLIDGDENGFTIDMLIKSQSDASTQNYTIEIADEFGNTDQVLVTISTGTSLGSTIMGAIFNADGPNGGGLNLDNGETVSSSSADAEIRDDGINIDLPIESNWYQRIRSASSNISIRQIVAGQNGTSEDFSFSNVMFEEELQDAWNTGIDFTSTNNDGDLVSNMINVGDVFMVYKDTGSFPDLYMIEVSQVNVTTNDNEDNYVVNIKR